MYQTSRTLRQFIASYRSKNLHDLLLQPISIHITPSKAECTRATFYRAIRLRPCTPFFLFLFKNNKDRHTIAAISHGKMSLVKFPRKWSLVKKKKKETYSYRSKVPVQSSFITYDLCCANHSAESLLVLVDNRTEKHPHTFHRAGNTKWGPWSHLDGMRRAV